MGSYLVRSYARKNSDRPILRFDDHNGHQRVWKGHADKAAYAGLIELVDDVLNRLTRSHDFPQELLDRLERQPLRIRKLFLAAGMAQGHQIGLDRALASHVDDYAQSLIDQGCAAGHIRSAKRRVADVLAAYEWENIADVSREQLQRQLANWGRFGKLRAEQYSTDGKLYVEQRDFLGRATLNHYAKQVKAFLAWLLDTKRTTVNPMMGYEMLAGDADTRRERRAYTNEELSRLRTATLASTRKTKMGHADRWLLYNFALVTGIRQGEIHSLTVASLDLDGDVPSVRVSADDSKTKRTAHVAVGRELATDLRAFVAGRLPDCKLFPTMPTRASIPPTLRRDLEDAGIPYQDDAGRYADFHSFRHTCGTRMARGGVALVQTQEHMRHA